MDVAYNEVNGFKAGLYKNIYTGEYIVSYGGTTSNSWENKYGKAYNAMADLLTDLSLLGVVSFGQPSQALDYLDRAKKIIIENGDGEINGITGHSLGGGLAQYAGLYSNIKTVTFNSAPLPYNYLGSALSFTDKINLEYDGIINSVKFNYEDKITNIMTPYDPISTISTAIMSLDESNTAYLFGAKFMFGIPQTQRMDYLLTGEQIFIPVEDQGGIVNFSNHSMDLIEETFLKYTNYTLEFDAVDNSGDLSIENLTITHTDGSQLGIGDVINWEIHGKDGKVKDGNNDYPINIPEDDLHEFIYNVTLKDGRILSKSIYTIPPPSNFQAEVSSIDSITLKWDKFKYNDDYSICISKKEIINADTCEESDGTLLISNSITELIDELETSSIYHFRIKTISDEYQSLWSNEIIKSLKKEDLSELPEPDIDLGYDKTKEELTTVVIPLNRKDDFNQIDKVSCYVYLEEFTNEVDIDITASKAKVVIKIPNYDDIQKFDLICEAYDENNEFLTRDEATIIVSEETQNPPSSNHFIKISNDGKALNDNSNTWSYIYDIKTKILWENKINKDDTALFDSTAPNYSLDIMHDYDNRYSIDNMSTIIQMMEAQSYFDISDWRLPSTQEFKDLISDPEFDNKFFPNFEGLFYTNTVVQNGVNSQTLEKIWLENGMTSIGMPTYLYQGLFITDDFILLSPHIASTGLGVIKKTGQTESYTDYDDGHYQKGVTPNYTREGEIVTDHITWLMWQDDEEAKMVQLPWLLQEDYDECVDDGNRCNHTAEGTASMYCNDLVFGGYSNWRLPSSKELESIVDYDKYDLAINPIFENTSSYYYWSSTSDKGYSSNAWVLDFNNGFVSFSKNANRFVRCVRAGE